MRTESTKKDIINFESVKPLNPIAPYLGGKRLLAKTIVPIIEKIPHNIYCEPFMGMGGVFFRRKQKPKCEAINDINSEIINMFRMVEKFPNYLADMLKFKVCSRMEFKQMLATPPLLLTELERAVRYLYIQKNAFGGNTQHQAFGVDVFGALARWTEDTFHFTTDEDNNESEALRQVVQGAFDGYGITIPAPAWYPPDTMLACDVKATKDSGSSVVLCEFVCLLLFLLSLIV